MNVNLHARQNFNPKAIRFYQNVILFLLALFMVQESHAQTWLPPVRTLNPNAGTGGSLRCQPSTMIINGNPAIAYMDEMRSDLVYVRATNATGTTWGTPITIEYKDYVGTFVSLELVNGYPAISYEVRTGNGGSKVLKYIRANDSSGTTWGTPVVLEEGIEYSYASLKVINGLPAVAYYDQTNHSLKFKRAIDNDGASWGSPIVLDAAGDVGHLISIVIVNNNPAIAYYDATNSHLKYIRAADIDGTTWNAPITLDPSNTTMCQFASMQMVEGNPAIAFYDFDYETDLFRLRYIRASDVNGTTWNAPINIKSGNDWMSTIGTYCTMQVIGGVPAICYVDLNNIGIHMIRASNSTGSTWSNPSTRIYHGYAANTSLLFVNNNPTIVYINSNNYTLEYFRATNTTGTAWPASTVSFATMGNVGHYNSAIKVDGFPAFTYYDNTNGDLKYVRALDATGATWGAPLTLDGATTDVGKYSSLQIVDGKPAVAYYDEENQNLKFVMANDVKGLTWKTPITVVSSGTAGQFASLEVVNGNPAIAYFDTYRHGSLKYVRSTNTTGTAWGSSVYVYEPEGWEVGRYASMKMVNGRPAIAFYSSQGYVQYVRANDANGSAWAAPVNPDGENQGGEWANLTVVDGMPAIVHSNRWEGLKYSRASQIDGNTWNLAIQVDEYNTGTYASLAIIGGRPAISYYDGNTKQLKYVESFNASGSSWNLPVVPDNSLNAGTFSSLLYTGTGPGIVYYSNQDLLPNFITTISSVLPVTMGNIKAYQKAEVNQIEWTALHEINLSKYVVERSLDGKQFIAIGSVLPKAMSPIIYYELTDNNPIAGMNFYRIKAIDMDGTVKYSAIVNVHRIKVEASMVSIFPNPILTNAITIQVNLPKGIYAMRVTSSSGVTVATKQLNHLGGSSSTNLSIAALMPAGIYQLTIIGEGVQISKQLLKN